MTVSELFYGFPASVKGNGIVKGLSYNSKKVKPGDVFFALRGVHFDGHKFVGEAVNRGAVGVCVEKDVRGLDCVVICVEDTRRALSFASARFFDYPSRDLCIVGVTGTNGKTTTAHLVQCIIGEKCGLLGTVGFSWGDNVVDFPNTTPESLELHSMFRRMFDDGMKYAVMEVSSHSLATSRVEDVDFAVGVFLGLGRDHLDFHKTMENYARTKAHLFDLVKDGGCRLVNGEDKYARYFMGYSRVKTFGWSDRVTIKGALRDVSIEGITIDVEGEEYFSPLVGRFNADNLLASVCVGMEIGVPLELMKSRLAEFRGVPGRMECVWKEDFYVFVDYAHTPDAIERVIRGLRELISGRIIIVFGAGGERDKGKRPLMGKAASLADVLVITNDNPRGENPMAIVHDILGGVEKGEAEVVLDRGKAIERAIELASPGDVVLICGKGHEEHQEIGGEKIPFSDREVVREVIGGKG